MDDFSASQSFVTLHDAWLCYEQSLRATMPLDKADATLLQAQTALIRYTLPAWGFPLPKGKRLSREEREQGLDFLKQVKLEQLQDALKLQDALFEQLQVAGNSRRNYRWALNNFIDWCREQPWSSSVAWPETKRSTPRQRERKGSATDVRLTTRKARKSYRLAPEQIPPTLQQELKAFHQFLIQPPSTARLDSPVRPATAQQHQQQLLRIFGWLHQVQAVPLGDLGFHCLIEFVPIPSRLQHSEAQPQGQTTDDKTIGLVQAYLEWLRGKQPKNSLPPSDGIQSPHTELKVLDTFLAVAKFVYWQEKQPNLGDIEAEFPTVTSLRRLRRQAGEKVKSHQLVSDRSQQMLEWTEFLEFGEVLRLECAPRFLQSTQSQRGGKTLGSLRTQSAIALSYQRFLLFTLFACLIPERLTALRTLKVSSLVQTDTKFENLLSSPEEGCLYQEESRWWVKLPATRKGGTVQVGSPIVPNLQYPDGRSLYQYLEEWLLAYSYEDEKGMVWEVPGLRSCFNPQHAYLFTMKNGQPYRSLTAFSQLLANPSYRIIGKIVNPYSLRHMFVSFHKADASAKLGNLEHSVAPNQEIHDVVHKMGHAPKNVPSQPETVDLAQTFLDYKANHSPLSDRS
jgi:hypothetical protein